MTVKANETNKTENLWEVRYGEISEFGRDIHQITTGERLTQNTNMTNTGTFTNPRPACFIVEAAPGFRRAARSLMVRALKAANIKGGHYMGRDEAKGYLITPRFLVDLTDEQMDRLTNELRKLADRDGWDRVPFDVYHD